MSFRQGPFFDTVTGKRRGRPPVCLPCQRERADKRRAVGWSVAPNEEQVRKIAADTGVSAVTLFALADSSDGRCHCCDKQWWSQVDQREGSPLGLLCKKCYDVVQVLSEAPELAAYLGV